MTPRLPAASAWQGRGGDPVAEPALIGQPLLVSLAAMVRRQPHRVAVADAGEALTYRQLWALASAYGAAIGDAPQGPVGLLLDGRARYAAGLLAGLFAQRACLPLDASAPPPRLAEMVQLARAGVVLASRDDPAARAAGAGRRLVVAPPLDGGADAADPAHPAGLGQDDPAFLLSTSGSSGQPKLIVHSQRTIAHRGFHRMAGAGSTAADRLMLVGAPSVYATISHLFGALFAGAAAHFIDMRLEGIGSLFTRLQRERITVLRAGASLGRTFAALDGARAALAHLRLIWLSGEAPTRDDIALLRRLAPPGCAILNGYGATEMVSFRWFVPAGGPDCWGEAGSGSVPIGMPDGEAGTVLLRDDGTPCEAGEAGELVVRSRYNALGEWQDGAWVPGRLIPDPADGGQRIYFSGDVARRQADGNLVVLGRKDRMLKINGQRMEPMEIETALRGQPGVGDAVVLPHRSGPATTLFAFVAVAPGAEAPAAEDLRSALRLRFPASMVPARVIIQASLPRLPGGKVDAQALLAGVPD